jgi:hypothetical protein
MRVKTKTSLPFCLVSRACEGYARGVLQSGAHLSLIVPHVQLIWDPHQQLSPPTTLSHLQTPRRSVHLQSGLLLIAALHLLLPS